MAQRSAGRRDARHNETQAAVPPGAASAAFLTGGERGIPPARQNPSSAARSIERARTYRARRDHPSSTPRLTERAAASRLPPRRGPHRCDDAVAQHARQARP